LFFAYILFVIFLLGKPKKPVLFLACLGVSLCFTLLFSWLLPKLDNYRVSVLDVGQGQAILFQSEGKKYLVDCGGDSGEIAADAVASELLSQGITSLDGIILTHYDDDHAGGILPLMSRISVERLYLPDLEDAGEIKNTLSKQYPDKITWVCEEMNIQEKTMSFTLFPGKPNTMDSESCLCILFQRENCAILLTGDRNAKGERYLLDHADLPKLDVLIVGHHGSNTSTDLSLLKQTKPDIAVISVGEKNSYGHPSQAVLDRLELFGCHIFRTDTHGTILFRG
jgi:competence protein ComEC